jgi:hypothetical protein
LAALDSRRDAKAVKHLDRLSAAVRFAGTSRLPGPLCASDRTVGAVHQRAVTAVS